MKNEYTEILELDKMLTKAKIPHTFRVLSDGFQVFYPNEDKKICDVVERRGSYGSESDLLEMCGLTLDDVEGYLTAEESFFRIKRHFDHENHLKKPVSVLPEKYEKLSADLKTAAEEARRAAYSVDDGGTCNFDSATIRLPRWRHENVKEAAKRVGLGCWYDTTGKRWIIGVPVLCQGDRRTEQAEAMSRVLSNLGYSAGMYHQMD